MEIRSLENIDPEILFYAFQRAFAEYEMQLDKSELLAMLKRRGFRPDLSFGVFDGDDIVSFTFNGIGDFDEVLTAYDTGTGTLKNYQGQGLATSVFNYSIPYLKKAGVHNYLLEVLQHNKSAVSVYKKIGFTVVRKFFYFKQKIEAITLLAKSSNFNIKPIDIFEYTEIETFWDFKPSWQNSIESIRRSFDNFICTGVFSEDKLIGYCVFEPGSGDITQLAVNKEHRRKGAGTLLLQHIIETRQTDAIKIINIDINCESMTAFLKSVNIEPVGKQYEMIKRL